MKNRLSTDWQVGFFLSFSRLIPFSFFQRASTIRLQENNSGKTSTEAAISRRREQEKGNRNQKERGQFYEKNTEENWCDAAGGKYGVFIGSLQFGRVRRRDSNDSSRNHGSRDK